ncbi:MAG: biopolymer transporter ExbD [Bacteroidia bacterium]|nr:biopolymer transporter ExbD [Bacteroidia bacterium]
MAEINTDSGGKKKHSKKTKRKKLSTRIDLTPMVDLGFLLITFFMLATTLIKPQTMEISMPSKEKIPEEQQTKIKSSKAMTIVLAKNDSIYYYFGTRENNVDPQLLTSDYSSGGIRKILLEKNAPIIVEVNDLKKKKDNNLIGEEEYKKQLSDIKDDTEAPVVVIKATEDADYKNMVDILDEMNICHIGKYAIVDITDFDRELIRNRK